LHLAVKNGNLKKVKLLVEKGADVNALTIREIGGSPLHIAAETGNIQILKYLILKGAKINPIFNVGGESPLSLALENNRQEAALFLMMKGADIRAKNHDGVSIIHKAAGLNCRSAKEIMEAVMQKGVGVNTTDNRGFTPVFYVRILEVAELLVKHGADVDFLASSGAGVNERTECGDTPLHSAALMGNYGKIIILVSSGADKNSVNNQGFTPLHIAAQSFYKDNCTIRLLILLGVSVNTQDNNGMTPLHLVRSPQKAKALVLGGADINIKDKEGRTPLKTAELMKKDDVAEYLRSIGGKE
jgi:ankyrin repeat protein